MKHKIKERAELLFPTTGIVGAIACDCIGVVYEFLPVKLGRFDIYKEPRFTDDTVMTLAVAKWLTIDPEHTHEKLVECMKELGRKYMFVGYGKKSLRWIISRKTEPYNSYGNGSAMRVSPCGFYTKTLDEALLLAKISAEVTHNHPEGIKGAQAIAACIFLARQGKDKKQICNYVEAHFEGYAFLPAEMLKHRKLAQIIHHHCAKYKEKYYLCARQDHILLS